MKTLVVVSVFSHDFSECVEVSTSWKGGFALGHMNSLEW
jgi:hypothetical protein